MTPEQQKAMRFESNADLIVLTRDAYRSDPSGMPLLIQQLITALEQAQRELAPRNGHTFESLQKMWEDTHIELAETLSKLTEAQRERDEAIKNVFDIGAQRDELQAKLVTTRTLTDKALEAALSDCEREANEPDKLAVIVGKMSLRHVCNEVRILQAKLLACEQASKEYIERTDPVLGGLETLSDELSETKAKLVAEQAAGVTILKALEAAQSWLKYRRLPTESSQEHKELIALMTEIETAKSSTHGTAFLAERERHVKALEWIAEGDENYAYVKVARKALETK